VAAIHHMHLFARRPPARDYPSLSLRAVSAYRNPGWEAQLSRVEGVDAVEVYYTRADERGASARDARVDRVMLEGVQPHGLKKDEFNLEPDDEVGFVQVLVPPDEALAAETIPMDRLLAMSDAELESAVKGRIVVVGDARRRENGREDYVTLADGRQVAGVYVVATAMEQLLRGWSVTRPSPTADRFAVLAVAVLGTVVGSGLCRRPGVRWGIHVIVSVGLVGAAVALYAGAAIYASPLVVVIVMIVASELTVLVRGSGDLG
jgi:hypothetical protein